MAGYYARLEKETAAARERFMALPLVRQILDLPHTGKAPPHLGEAYVRFLEESYHHVCAAPKVYALAGSRVEGSEAIQEWLTRHAVDEFGHHRWILDDLKALGADTQKIVQAPPSPACDALVGYMYYVAGHGNPVGVLGDSYVIEGLSQLFASDVARNLRGSLGIGENAVAYLAHHGELDQSHMAEFGGVVDANVTSRKDYDAILQCALVEFDLYGRILERVQESLLCEAV